VVFILIRGFNPLFLSVDAANYVANIILRVSRKSNSRLRSAFHRDADGGLMLSADTVSDLAKIATRLGLSFKVNG
jgi:hypothetical protein